MDDEKLSFADITPLRADIAEVVVHEGVEMTLGMVHKYHAYLQRHFIAPFSLLVDKRYTYSYTFDAQLELANIPEINVMAVVTHHHASEFATHAMSRLPGKENWHLRVFSDRNDALCWLIEEQAKLRTVAKHA